MPHFGMKFMHIDLIVYQEYFLFFLFNKIIQNSGNYIPLGNDIF